MSNEAELITNLLSPKTVQDNLRFYTEQANIKVMFYATAIRITKFSRNPKPSLGLSLTYIQMIISLNLHTNHLITHPLGQVSIKHQPT